MERQGESISQILAKVSIRLQKREKDSNLESIVEGLAQCIRILADENSHQARCLEGLTAILQRDLPFK